MLTSWARRLGLQAGSGQWAGLLHASAMTDPHATISRARPVLVLLSDNGCYGNHLATVVLSPNPSIAGLNMVKGEENRKPKVGDNPSPHVL